MLLVLLCARGHAQRMVFAHYMLTNQDYQADDDPTQEKKIAAYEREIEQAQALGIDGFALNAGGWLKQPYYVRYAAQMFEAAARLNNGFKLMFSADFCCGNTTADAEDMMRRFVNDPRFAPVYFRYQGRFVLTTFAGDKLGVAAWKKLREDLASGASPSAATFPNALKEVSGVPSSATMNIFLVPAFFWGGELPDRATVERGIGEWKDVIDGSFYWGIAGVPGSRGALDNVRSSEAYAAVTHAQQKLYMAPVALQFWGANANRYYEYSGGAGMRAMWMDAIERTKPGWVEIITWNDFIEGTYISPIDDPNRYPGANFLNSSDIPVGTRGYFHSHAAAGDLMSYYIRWYKSGKQPAITNDTIYWFYRTQPAAADAGVPPVKNKYGPVADVIYITANLKNPATLRVESGGQATLIALAAGSHDVLAPFAVGDPPRFSLLRAGRIVLEAAGADRIKASPQYNNFYYSTGEMRSH
ncbi:MAG TPA: endo-1,3-alpha-glucanase family glycosylhydrolase [Acidobacteriaceae bacterium]